MKKSKLEYKVVKKIPQKGYPTKAKNYHRSHEAANNAEKKIYGIKSFKNTLKTDKKLPAHEQAGTHSRSGKIKISQKVPPAQRQEVALHEYVEWKHQERKPCKICGLQKNSKGHK